VNRTANRTVPGLLAVALIAAACSGGDDAAETTVASTSTVEATTTEAPTTVAPTTTTTVPATTTTTIPDVPRMPLTGEPIDDPSEVPDRPALVVKISNAPQSVLPQSGLNDADLVIEEVINANVTRLAAVDHSTESDPVGPIRSGRAQDINLLLALNRPLFAWSGGNPAVTRAVQESDLIDLDFRFNPGYYRRSGRTDANTLYSSTEVLWAQTPEEAGRPTRLFPYLPVGETPEGDPATEITVILDSVRAQWTYDAESGRYLRTQNGQEHTTEQGSEINRVWADNVVVMMADYGLNPADGNPDAQVLGSNPVYVFSGGTVRVGTWLRFQPTDPLDFFDNVDDLNRIGLAPGRTWLEIPRNLDDVLSWTG
jgi:hypothetical protein